MEEHKVVILGGGFAGLKCALELQKKNLKNVRTTLISDRPHFEYHGALYRLVAGHSPLEVCLPIRDVIDEDKVEFVVEKVTQIDKENREVKLESGSSFKYDTLVIALGAETNYFGIEGLEEFSFGMKTISSALALKVHIHEVIESCVDGTKADNLCSGNFVVVGAGATGVEIAAELAVYTKKLAKVHKIEPSLMNVELIEAGPRILPTLPEKFASKIENKIRALGVNVRLNRAIERNDIAGVYLKDMQLKTQTVIWTAGVAGNHLIKESGLEVNKIGKVEVDEHLRAKSNQEIYLSGDAAVTKYSGMAQTAIYDGAHIADSIESSLGNGSLPKYNPKKPIYAIPAGPGWAGTIAPPFTFYGKTGWFLRRVLDFIVFTSFLPLKKAINAFSSHEQTCEACPVCCEYQEEYDTNL